MGDFVAVRNVDLVARHEVLGSRHAALALVGPDQPHMARPAAIGVGELSYPPLQRVFVLGPVMRGRRANRFEVILEVNQPVLPTPENISPLRIHFEFRNDGEWLPFPTRVDLTQNCTASGATLTVTPVGVLPQNRVVRVRMGPEFEDLVGNRNILALTEFATMDTETFTDDGTAGVGALLRPTDPPRVPPPSGLARR